LLCKKLCGPCVFSPAVFSKDEAVPKLKFWNSGLRFKGKAGVRPLFPRAWFHQTLGLYQPGFETTPDTTPEARVKFSRLPPPQRDPEILKTGKSP
jgi:hypothetical protein